MKINGPLRPGEVARRKATRRSGVTGFSVASGAAGQASRPAPRAPMNAPAALLALQEVDDPRENRGGATGRGHGILDELDNLKLAMIEDRLSEGALRRLAVMIDSPAFEIADRRLADVVRDIEVRAAVEIAKREGDDPA